MFQFPFHFYFDFTRYLETIKNLDADPDVAGVIRDLETVLVGEVAWVAYVDKLETLSLDAEYCKLYEV